MKEVGKNSVDIQSCHINPLCVCVCVCVLHITIFMTTKKGLMSPHKNNNTRQYVCQYESKKTLKHVPVREEAGMSILDVW